MTFVHQLHTKSDRKYHGKYPTRSWQFSNGGKGSSIIAKHLQIRAPHFVELNDGRRFYIDGFWLQANFELPVNFSRLIKVDWAPIIADAKPLDIDRYNHMLKEINLERANSRASHNAQVAARKAGRPVIEKTYEVPLSRETIKFIAQCEDQHSATRREDEKMADYILRLERTYK